jgi:hypothetical protein
MSDTPNDPASADAAPSAETPPAAPESAREGTAGGDPFAELPADQPLFPRSYVEKLRTEGHKYRTEAQTAAQKFAEYDQVYNVYPDEDRQVWLNIARTWAVDPVRAAQAMQTIAASVLEEGETMDTSPDDTADTTDNTDYTPESLTPDAVQDMIQQAMAAQAQSAAEAQAIDEVYAEVRSHGYDPNSRDGFMVLWTANNETDGDIAAAVERMQQYRQGIIDDYVAGRGGAHPTPAPNGGIAANQQVEISSFEDARKATEAFLRGQRGAGA